MGLVGGVVRTNQDPGGWDPLTLQAAAGGLVLGVGPSHAWYVRDQLGLPCTSPLRHTREYLTVLRVPLHGEHFRHSGEFFTVDTGLAIEAEPPVPLVSALGPRMLEVVAELADGVVTTWVSPEMIADHVVPRTAYRASPDRAGLTGPADTVVVCDESTISGALARYRDAGATDLLVSSLGSPRARVRTLDVATDLVRR